MQPRCGQNAALCDVAMTDRTDRSPKAAPGALRRQARAAALGAALLGACASPPPPLPEGTQFLGEVARIASRDDLLDGFALGPDRVPSSLPYLKRCGIAEGDIADRRFAVVRYYYYWHNVSAGVVHSGVRLAAMPPGVAVRSGNIVEVEVTTSAADPSAQCGAITRVRAADAQGAGCVYRRNERHGFGAVLGALSPIGGPGSASLDCPDIEGTGWEPAVVGPYAARAWRKLPSPAR